MIARPETSDCFPHDEPAEVPSRSVGDLALQVVDKISAMVAYWDMNQRCHFANEAYQEWFGRSRQEMIGISMQELLGPLYALNLPHITEALRGNLQVFERTIPLPDGRVKHTLATYTPDIVSGQVVGFFVHVADITPIKELEWELRIAKEHAENLATHDYLTGLPNRILFTDRFTQALAGAQRSGAMMALMIIDLDEFKDINDTFGHAEGDKLLRTVADRLSAAVRSADTLARIGGDEFAVICANVGSPEEVVAISQRLGDLVSRPYLCKDTSIIPRLSVGVALYPEDGETQEDLMVGADLAMYEAKRSGRGHVGFISTVLEDVRASGQDLPSG